jgi:hypothetical protein
VHNQKSLFFFQSWHIPTNNSYNGWSKATNINYLAHTYELALGKAIKAAFIPKLLYRIELFWKDKKKIEDKLQVIINHAIRFALSAFRKTPIPALQVEGNIPPVSVIIHQMQSDLPTCYLISPIIILSYLFFS